MLFATLPEKVDEPVKLSSTKSQFPLGEEKESFASLLTKNMKMIMYTHGTALMAANAQEEHTLRANVRNETKEVKEIKYDS